MKQKEKRWGLNNVGILKWLVFLYEHFLLQWLWLLELWKKGEGDWRHLAC